MLYQIGKLLNGVILYSKKTIFCIQKDLFSLDENICYVRSDDSIFFRSFLFHLLVSTVWARQES